MIPPNILFHGTATNVGARHGIPTVLKIDAKQMVREHFDFYISENKVWLSSTVPKKYINILEITNNK